MLQIAIDKTEKHLTTTISKQYIDLEEMLMANKEKVEYVSTSAS